MICPLMSKIVDGSQSSSDLIEVRCKEKECAFWEIEMRDGQIYQERCGVVK